VSTESLEQQLGRVLADAANQLPIQIPSPSSVAASTPPTKGKAVPATCYPVESVVVV
jgi:hypothetical protein